MKILCAGAVLADFVARVPRHPNQDDEVFVPELMMVPGGSAANTAVALARLGHKVGFLGRVGSGDAVGQSLVADLNDEGVDTSCIARDANAPTGMVFIAVDPSGDRRMYAYSGAANNLAPEDIPWSVVNTLKVLYLSSLKNLDSFRALARGGQDRGIPVVANPGMLGIERSYAELEPFLRDLTVLILSETELRVLGTKMALEKRIPSSGPEQFSIDNVTTEILTFGLDALVITRGNKGVRLYRGKTDLSKQDLPAFRVPVKDTTGAGDAFSAGFVSRFADFKIGDQMLDLADCCRYGAAVASLVIQRFGARNGLPSRREVELFLNSAP